MTPRAEYQRQQAALSKDWSLNGSALMTRYELGGRVERALWRENTRLVWESVTDVLMERMQVGTARVKRWTKTEQLVEAEVFSRLSAELPQHGIDCPCTGCEAGWRRLIRDVLPRKHDERVPV